MVKGDFLDAVPQHYEQRLKAMACLLGSVKVWKQKQEQEPIGKLQAVHHGIHGVGGGGRKWRIEVSEGGTGEDLSDLSL